MPKLFATPIHRPVATSMFFLAISLMGLFAWYRIPIELIPSLTGEQIFVQMFRPGSEPDVVEREMLIPLESRISELSGIDETFAQVNGAFGNMTIQFDRGSNYRVRELEIRRIAADLNRTQPEGSFINVGAENTSFISRLVLQIQIIGGADANSLRDFAEDQLLTRFASVPGVSQALVQGAAPREVTVWIDPNRCAEYGVQPAQVSAALRRSVQRLRYLGGAEQSNLRQTVILDGRPEGVVSLGDIRIDQGKPVLLRHVADIQMGAARADSEFRVNGKTAVGLIVFQDEGANLVDLGRELRKRLQDLKTEFTPYGIDFVIGFDAAQGIEDQIDHLKKLALSGFLIALVVLFLFLKEWRAVTVVAIAVPVSLLVAGALLYLGGYTLNVITLSGLAIGVGMLIDNSIVVYEAVQRCLEKGLSPENAAIQGIQRTIRAILTASATSAIVYLPVVFLVDDVFIRSMLILVAVAILTPLLASLVVAVGLVPLLSQRIAAPVTLARLRRREQLRDFYQGNLPPQRSRELFSGLLKVALRRPTPWIAGVMGVVVFTIVVALPWVLVSTFTQEAPEADEVRLEVVMEGNNSLDSASTIFERLEAAAMDVEGVDRVTSNFQEGNGTLVIRLVDKEERPGDLNAGEIRRTVYSAAENLKGVEINPVDVTGGGGSDSSGGNQGGSSFGGAPSQIVLSGPDMQQLNQLAAEIQQRLSNISAVESTSISGNVGREELHVEPIAIAIQNYKLFPENVLRSLNSIRREGNQLQVGFTLADGREIPLTVRQPEVFATNASWIIEDLRIATGEGALPLSELAMVNRELPPPTITHHNGRRELSVNYRLSDEAPEIGPARQVVDQQIQQAARTAFLPVGYTVETAGTDESSSVIETLFIPILLMLFAVMAIAFESLTMPLLILVAVPLTILGGTWALVIAGMGADIYAAVGAVALLGLTVNPAIILVDRMQARLHNSGGGGGSAALFAVRERTRPVLMTSCTTIAGLWPLALVTGAELEIWPPFATVIIGGLTTSTLLTLLVIPVGFMFLARLDRLIARLGPWVIGGWALVTTAVIAPLIISDVLTTYYWQIVTTLLVAGINLWVAKLLFIEVEPIEVDTDSISIEASYLSKVYGKPGPVAKAWQSGVEFAKKIVLRNEKEIRERALTFFILLLGTVYLASNFNTFLWQLLCLYIGGILLSKTVAEIYRLSIASAPATSTISSSISSVRSTAALSAASVASSATIGSTGPATAETVSEQSSIKNHKADTLESRLLFISPWLVLIYLFVSNNIVPVLQDGEPKLLPLVFVLLAIITYLLQFARVTAKKVTTKTLDVMVQSGSLQYWRTGWRRFCVKFFSLGLERESVTALSNVSFKATQGMIGILGPNGAGKTTLLRLLAAILEPSSGTTRYGGVEKRSHTSSSLSELIGYLPQEFGLPEHLTADEYLRYYAILYRVGNRQQREERVKQLLKDVGLDEKKHEKIGGYSGGMKQRVAVARTLLRLPPIIIVDEPTVGLDPRERIRFRNLLAKLAKGRVVLFSTHVVEDVAVSCERVLVFSSGSIVYDGKPEDLTEVARDLTWEVSIAANEDRALLEDAKIIDQIPEPNGGSLLRILCASKPHANAREVEPRMEDGYLQLQKQGFKSGAVS